MRVLTLKAALLPGFRVLAATLTIWFVFWVIMAT